MSAQDQTSPPVGRYPSLASFYNSDPRRISSREIDVGLWWREGPDGPLYRAAWVSDTGELYLARLGPTVAGGGAVEVLGEVADRECLESLLEGWREHCGEASSLSWLRERVGRMDERARVTHVRLAASMAATGARLAATTTRGLELPAGAAQV
jgi:hypothetical protein